MSESNQQQTRDIRHGLDKMNRIVIGVCALDKKTRSTPMRNILGRLKAYGEFEVVVFGSQTILHKPVEEQPLCDIYISFHSTNFPLDKSCEYVRLREPITINDVFQQKLILDRRLVYDTLSANQIPVPNYLVYDQLDKKNFCKSSQELYEFDDQIELNGKRIYKPFVEKPVSGEDHNVYIYYSTKEGGGSRRLFRKIRNRSSQFYPDVSKIRRDDCYIYEEFCSGGVDVKVYTIFSENALAEKRKAPTVDGIVERNFDGKEVRVTTRLKSHEREISRKVCSAFKQNICGFDLIRQSPTESYVIDVNGQSFAKGNLLYYDDCARLIRLYALNQMNRLIKFRYEFSGSNSRQMRSEEEGFKDKTSTHLHNLKQMLRPQTAPVRRASATCVHSLHECDKRRKNRITPVKTCLNSGKCEIYKVDENHNDSNKQQQNCKLISQHSRSPKNKKNCSDDCANLNMNQYNQRHILLGLVSVFRHGDRTPKQKLKFSTCNKLFQDFYADEIGRKNLDEKRKNGFELLESNDLREKLQFRDLKFKKQVDFERVLVLIEKIIERKGVYDDEKCNGENFEKFIKKLKLVREILTTPEWTGTKIQLRKHEKCFEKDKNLKCVFIEFILKWGGSITEAGLRQCEQYGPVFRKEMLRGTPDDREGFLYGMQVWTSEEKRVKESAKAFINSFLLNEKIPHKFQLTEHLLDDISAGANELIGSVKKDIFNILHQNSTDTKLLGNEEEICPIYGTNTPQIQYSFRRLINPFDNLKILLSQIRKLVEKIQHKYDVDPLYKAYGGENILAMKKRWDILLRDLYDPSSNKFNTTKLPDVYDCLKYDVLHNSDFMLGVEKLYYDAKRIADFVIPAEYGIKNSEKIRIGREIAGPLVNKILANLNGCLSQNCVDSRVFFYFTSESYMQSLKNLLLFSGIAHNALVAESVDSMDLNYLTHGVIRLFEDPSRSKDDPMHRYLSIMFSSGASSNPFACADDDTCNFQPASLPLPLNGKCSQTEFKTKIETILKKDV